MSSPDRRLVAISPDAPEGRAIAIAPGAGLAEIVAALEDSERVVAVIADDEVDPAALDALASRVRSGKLFGLAQAVPGTPVHTEQVSDAESQARCLQAVVEAAEQAGVPRKLHATIEQCLDELLANALYAAPVDDRGQPVFAHLSPQERVAVRLEHTVVVEHACDGARFALSVRDAFGTLRRATLMRVLRKCLHGKHAVDRKIAGAGVGLYLLVSSASEVAFHVVPGVACEVSCTFDLRAQTPRLARIAYIEEPTDVTGTLVPAKRIRAGSLRAGKRRGRGRLAALGIAVAALAAGAVIAVPRLVHRGPAAKAPHATVVIDSQPPGATVTIDGKRAGTTPVAVTALPPGSTAQAVLELRGYQPATARVEVPAAGAETRLVQRLVRSPDFVIVRFTSDPAGARVVALPETPELDRTYTPADVFVEAGRVQRFELTMPHHVPVVLDPFTPARGAGPIDEHATLPPDPKP